MWFFFFSCGLIWYLKSKVIHCTELSAKTRKCSKNICSTNKWSNHAAILGRIYQSFLFCIFSWQLCCSPLAFAFAARVISAAALNAELHGIQSSLQTPIQNLQEGVLYFRRKIHIKADVTVAFAWNNMQTGTWTFGDLRMSWAFAALRLSQSGSTFCPPCSALSPFSSQPHQNHSFYT